MDNLKQAAAAKAANTLLTLVSRASDRDVEVSYPLVLGRLPVLDVLAIADRLVLRAAAGALLFQATISPWRYLSAAGLASSWR